MSGLNRTKRMVKHNPALLEMAQKLAQRVQLSPVSDLVLRSLRSRASRRMNGTSGASWFETALARLLTMRI